MTDALVCDRCAGAMTYKGRISLPRQTIYQCVDCGNQKWSDVPAPYRAPAAESEQPQAQQQQQPQAKPDED